MEGIRYMETWENMVVEDLTYSELRYIEAQSKDLCQKLATVPEDKENLQKCLLLTVETMVSFSRSKILQLITVL